MTCGIRVVIYTIERANLYTTDNQNIMQYFTQFSFFSQDDIFLHCNILEIKILNNISK